MPRPSHRPQLRHQQQLRAATLGHSHGRWNGKLKLYVDDGTFDWLQWSDREQHAFRSITDSTNYGLRWRESVIPMAGRRAGLRARPRHLRRPLRGTSPRGRSTGDRPPVPQHGALRPCSATPSAATISVTPSIGVRYNDSRYFGGQWGTQAGLNVGFAGHSLYANYAHGFNLPGVYAAVQYSGWGRGDQWQDLEAETIDHLELGWLTSFGRSLSVTASLFRDEVDNAIRFVPPPPPPPLFANIGAYTVTGSRSRCRPSPSTV